MASIVKSRTTAAPQRAAIDKQGYKITASLLRRRTPATSACSISCDRCHVLVCFYHVSWISLHHLCRTVHLFDTAISGPMRLGNWRTRQDGRQWKPTIPSCRSFNARQVLKAAGKAIPGLVAELNRNMFSISHTDDGTLNVGKWARRPF